MNLVSFDGASIISINDERIYYHNFVVMTKTKSNYSLFKLSSDFIKIKGVVSLLCREPLLTPGTVNCYTNFDLTAKF